MELNKINDVKDLIRIFYKYSINAIPIISAGEKIETAFFRGDIERFSSKMENMARSLNDASIEILKPVDPEKFDEQVIRDNHEPEIPVFNNEFCFVGVWSRLMLINYLHGNTDVGKDVGFRKIFDIFPLPVIVLDTNGIIEYKNQLFTKSFEDGAAIRAFQELTEDARVNISHERLMPICHPRREEKYNALVLQYLPGRYFAVFQDDDDLSDGPLENAASPPVRSMDSVPNELTAINIDDQMAEYEMGIMKRYYDYCGGNLSSTAKMLGLKRQTLTYKLKKHRII